MIGWRDIHRAVALDFQGDPFAGWVGEPQEVMGSHHGENHRHREDAAVGEVRIEIPPFLVARVGDPMVALVIAGIDNVRHVAERLSGEQRSRCRGGADDGID
jgi:hypothetical protein